MGVVSPAMVVVLPSQHISVAGLYEVVPQQMELEGALITTDPSQHKNVVRLYVALPQQAIVVSVN